MFNVYWDRYFIDKIDIAELKGAVGKTIGNNKQEICRWITSLKETSQRLSETSKVAVRSANQRLENAVNYGISHITTLVLGAGFTRNRISFAASMSSPPAAVTRDDGTISIPSEAGIVLEIVQSKLGG